MIQIPQKPMHDRAIGRWNAMTQNEFPKSKGVGDLAGQMMAIIGIVHYMDGTIDEKREAGFQVAVTALQAAFDLGEHCGKPVTQEEIDALDATELQESPEFKAACERVHARLMLDFAHGDLCDAFLQRIGEHHCVKHVWVVPRVDGSSYVRLALTCFECGKHEFSYPETLDAPGLPHIWRSFLKRHSHA